MADPSAYTHPKNVAAPPTDADRPPLSSKTFTSFAAALDLAGADAPANKKHRPCAIIVNTTAADQHLDYTDDGGANVMPFSLEGTFGPIRMAPLSIQTTTNVGSITVFWS